MNVELECIAKLAKYGSCGFKESTLYKLEDGQTVAELVRRANFSVEDIEVVIVNNTIADTGTILSDGDRVELVPVFGI